MAHTVGISGLLAMLLGCLGPWAEGSDTLRTFHMNTAIQLIEVLENHHQGASAFQVVELLRTVSDDGNHQPLHTQFPLLEPDLRFLAQLMTHEVRTSTEHGVVLTPDGTTVAFSPLLAGIVAGLKRDQEATGSTQKKGSILDGQEAENNNHPADLVSSPKDGHATVGREPEQPRKPNVPLSNNSQEWMDTTDNLYAATLAKDLGLAYLQFQLNESQASIGPDGCWDNVTLPQIFTLAGPPSQLTNAFLNGALDGVILGNFLMQEKAPAGKLSLLLKDYYSGQGVAGQATMRSNFRRQRFLAISSIGKLEEQVKKVLFRYKEEKDRTMTLGHVEYSRIPHLSRKAVENFYQTYLECPAIIPRCMWEASLYRGTPTLLNLPLEFVYIHHTYEPSQPCRTFPACAADMRSMQRFHQDDRGWDDIGYNFVVGADGYLYEGRGWRWQGAHTKGNNAKGYGVSFIGDYSAQLPPGHALELVRDRFLQCAVSAGHLLPGYTLHGHRQLGQTTCPGEALFREIQTWHGFKEV